MPAMRTSGASRVLKSTTSRCPVCRLSCAATVEERGGKVFLSRTCATHGPFTACIASDARFYWLAKGKDENREGACCAGGACCAADGKNAGTLGRNAGGRGENPIEMLSTCLALIEIVNSCNLACPTCYADSPPNRPLVADAIEQTDGVDQPSAHASTRVSGVVPADDIKRRVDDVIARKGRIEILQFSGGEPTLHPDLIDLCRWAKHHEHIDFLLLNTNGVRLAKEPELCAQLGGVFRDGGMQIYLQFDGVQEAGQRSLRGADLRAMREKAIARLAAAGIPVTLAMTVTRENLPHLWSAVEFGLKNPAVHGITFQPEFLSGRNAAHDGASKRSMVTCGNPFQKAAHECPERLNTADIILGAVEQSGGQLRFEDFTPLPCGDPNCATIGYLIRQAGRVWHVSDFLDFTKLQGFLHDKVHYTLADLARCGCENTELGELLKTLEHTRSMAFRIMVKPFMDAWTWDEDRIDRCCTHVIRPDGKLDSFCRYYSGFPDASPSC
ncbi:MAG: radical SAM protein [Verrucomicrobiaceae bacterium]|nr:radical SAM protein [Verrucomicrobiaceae bacterium]